MGSWNKTCGISNLPIRDDEPVYVFVLVENTYVARCYSHSLWSPVLLPFLSYYDGHGGGTNSHSNIRYVLDSIRDHMVSMEAGPNAYHDIPVNPKNLDESVFFDAIHENRLEVRIDHDKSSLVDMVMMRKDIVDYICHHYVCESYVGNGNGTSGYLNSYITFGFNDVISEIPSVIERMREQLSKLSDVRKQSNNMPDHFWAEVAKVQLLAFDTADTNVAQRYIVESLSSTANLVGTQLLNPLAAMTRMILANEVEEHKQFLHHLILGTFIHEFMETSRKVWVPACHEGSQGDDRQSYRVLCDSITTVISLIDDEDE